MKGLLDDAHTLARAIVADMTKGVRDAAGMIGLIVSYVLAVLVLLSPLVVAAVLVIELTT